MRDDHYFVVKGWMVNRLKLKGNERDIFALIYGFTWPQECGEPQWCTCSQTFFADATLTSKKTVARSLESLIERGLIIKEYECVGSFTYPKYAARRKWIPEAGCFEGDEHPSDKMSTGGGQNVPTERTKCPDPVDKMSPNNIVTYHSGNTIADNPPSPMYSLRNDKEASYGREATSTSKLLTGEYIGYPPQGEAPSAPSKSGKKNSSDIPFDQIRDLYNTICTSLPKCRTVTDKRKAAIRARWSEGFKLPDFEEAFKAAQESDFLKGLSGDGTRKWRADFDFCVGTRMVRIIEGAYSGEVDESEIGFGYQGRGWSGDVTNGDF